jgi:peptidoglycan/xylan/chitin deacetylase (PgdA/CDA1 family)
MKMLKSLWRRRLNRVSRLFLPAPRKGWRCLLYHVVAPSECRDVGQMQTPAALFEQQMTYLAENGYRVIRCGELVEKVREGVPPDPKTVAISFDDGDAGLADQAFPILERRGFPATVFLISRPDGRSVLSADQIRRARQGGLIEFGCHGRTHRRLKGLSPSDLAQETQGAKRELEDSLGLKLPLFAYPFGAYDSWDLAAARALAQAGFFGAFTSIYGVNRPRTDPYLLRRTRVSWLDSLPHFGWLLEGAGDWYAWVQRAQCL